MWLVILAMRRNMAERATGAVLAGLFCDDITPET
jgi:hypothetical protein